MNESPSRPASRARRLVMEAAYPILIRRPAAAGWIRVGIPGTRISRGHPDRSPSHARMRRPQGAVASSRESWISRTASCRPLPDPPAPPTRARLGISFTQLREPVAPQSDRQ